MATDIILNKNNISLTGGPVNLDNSLNVEAGARVGKTLNAEKAAIKESVIADTLHARTRVKAKHLVAKEADIAKLNIASTVGEKSVSGKITIGNTTLTDKEIRCKKISAGGFEGLLAKVVTLTVTNQVKGSLKVSGDITAKKVTQLSDARCKQDINVLSNSLDKVINLQGVSFNWQEDELMGDSPAEDKQIGFIAQDVEKVLPEVVTKNSQGQLSLDYSSIIPLLVEGMKTQQKNIQSQEEQLKSKSQEIQTLQQKIAEVESKLEVLLDKVTH